MRNGLRSTFASAVLALSMGSFAIAGPGDLDPSFGISGSTFLNLGLSPNTEVQWIKVLTQADGKILFIGNADWAILVRRFHTDGTLDTTYGLSGDAVVSIWPTEFIGGVVRDAEITADGKVLLAGRDTSAYTGRVKLWRIDQNGILDNTFGTEGSVSLSSKPSEMHGVEIRAGKIYLLFTTDPGNLNLKKQFLARRNSNGSADTTFGLLGFVTPSTTSAMDIEIQASNGRIYLSTGNSIRAYTPSGSVDSTFGRSGIATIPFLNCPPYNPGEPPFSSVGAQSVELTDSGRIMVGISTVVSNGQVGFFRSAMLAFTSAGAVDNGFNGGQLVCVNGSAQVKIAPVPDGRIVTSPGLNAISRYNSDGSLDASFVAAQTEPTAFLLVQPLDWKVIVAGESHGYRLLY